MYVDVQYKIGSGSWVTLEDGNAIAAGGGNAETYTIPTAQSHGTTIYWQYEQTLQVIQVQVLTHQRPQEL